MQTALYNTHPTCQAYSYVYLLPFSGCTSKKKIIHEKPFSTHLKIVVPSSKLLNDLIYYELVGPGHIFTSVIWPDLQTSSGEHLSCSFLFCFVFQRDEILFQAFLMLVWIASSTLKTSVLVRGLNEPKYTEECQLNIEDFWLSHFNESKLNTQFTVLSSTDILVCTLNFHMLMLKLSWQIW